MELSAQKHVFESAREIAEAANALNDGNREMVWDI
jgi:hypothetical protein